MWHTWNCIFGWPVQGIWHPSYDGTDINYVDRSKEPTEEGYHLVAVADDFGKVKVYRYPCTEETAEPVELKGHSSHVTRVKFTRNDRHLISAGGNDACVFQWKVSIKGE